MPKMNNVFSPVRFAGLVKKMIRENWRELAMSLVMLEGLLLIMMILITAGMSPREEDSLDLSAAMLEGGKVTFTIFGCIAGSMMFGGMASPRQRLPVLMTPASALEKYTARWVIYVVGYVVSFALLFVAADVLNYVIFSVLPPSDNFVVPLLGTLRCGCLDNFHWGMYGCVYLIFTSLFALGSVLWPKRALLKTFFALAVILAAYWSIAYWGMSIAPQSYTSGGYIIENVEVTASVVNRFAFAVGVVSAVIFYVLTYYRFKESEIIDRW